MKNRLTILMTLAVIAGFSILILMNVAALFGIVSYKYISPNDVRGMAVEHEKVLYTLNFDQQNALVDIFNRSIPVTKEQVAARKMTVKKAPDIQRVIIYRFNAPDIEIKPVAYVKKTGSLLAKDEESASMVFSAPDFYKDGYLEESIQDDIYQILSKTYD